jgi:hypothetical protein
VVENEPLRRAPVQTRQRSSVLTIQLLESREHLGLRGSDSPPHLSQSVVRVAFEIVRRILRDVSIERSKVLTSAVAQDVRVRLKVDRTSRDSRAYNAGTYVRDTACHCDLCA